MTYERIMGLNVTDDEQYQQYREGMMPILASYGGAFGFDFKVSEVLKSKSDDKINRVFTIEFPSKEIMENFFADYAYLEIKSKFFNRSVESVTTISLHEKSV